MKFPARGPCDAQKRQLSSSRGHDEENLGNLHRLAMNAPRTNKGWKVEPVTAVEVRNWVERKRPSTHKEEDKARPPTHEYVNQGTARKESTLLPLKKQKSEKKRRLGPKADWKVKGVELRRGKELFTWRLLA